MSTLSEAGLQEALRQAMKSRQTREVAVLRGLLAAVKNVTIERRTSSDAALGEQEVVQIIRREIKQREEAIAFAERAQRSDLVDKNRFERDFLQRFLPDAVGPADLEVAVRRHFDAGATSIGPLMGKLKQEFGSRLDGKTASEYVREFLKEQGGS